MYTPCSETDIYIALTMLDSDAIAQAVPVRKDQWKRWFPPLEALIDRIVARIGTRRVVVHLPQDTHIPERAELPAPAQHHLAAATQAAWPVRVMGEPPLRPLRLFDRPEPINVPVATVPDGPPHRFTWRRAVHAVVRVEGPERVAMEWWKQDGKVLTRDYFRIESRDGVRLWVYREGLYERETTAPRWFLHGLFA